MKRIPGQDHASDTKRVNRGYKLREDLIASLKHCAIEEGRKLYEVMESAIEEYLDRHCADKEK
jgi:hypothetical protein